MKRAIDTDEGGPFCRSHTGGRVSKNFGWWTPDTRCPQVSCTWIKCPDLNARASSWCPQPQRESARVTWLSSNRTKIALGDFHL